MEFDEYKRRVQAYTAVVSRQWVLPIYITKDRPALLGSGFLVKTARSRYVVSAEHVFTGQPDRPRDLFCFVGNSECTSIVAEKILRVEKDEAGRNLLDVAILPLKEGTAEWVGTEVRKFVPIDELVYSSEGFQQKEFGVTGFPLSKNKPSGSLKLMPQQAYSLLQRSSDLNKYAAMGLRPESHIVLDFDQSIDHPLEGIEGPPRRFPNPRGISGAPVYSYSFDASGNISGVIEGVAIEHYPEHKAMVCTRIGPVIRMIRQFEAGLI